MSMKLLGLALAGLVLAGCAATPDAEAPEAGPAPTTGAPAATPAPEPTATAATSAPVPEVLKFTATTVDGQPFDGATLAGKPAVFWFWAAWCPKCKGDAAQVRDLQQALAGKVNIVGVAGLGSGQSGMKSFVSNYQLSGFPQLADDKGDVWKRFAVPSQHYYVILDAEGKEIHRGPLSVSDLQKKIGG